MRHSSVGKLRYSLTDGLHTRTPYKLIVEVDPELARFYRGLIPAEFAVRKPKYPPHISLVRNITPPNLDAWGRHEGREIGFEYDGWIYNDETYWWLNILSEDCETIREELGLPKWGYPTLSPDNRHIFHCTIANMKPDPTNPLKENQNG